MASGNSAQGTRRSSVEESDLLLFERGISWSSMTQLMLPELSGAEEAKQHKRRAKSPRSAGPKSHTLNERWSIWLWEPCNEGDLPTGRPVGQLSKLGTFGTICDFWVVFNSAKRITTMRWRCEYYLFKESFCPTTPRLPQMDEGHWIASFDPKHHESMDRYWMLTMIAIVEDRLKGYGERLLGAGVSLLPTGDKITVWSKREHRLDKPRRGLGNMLELVLGIRVRFHYVCHRPA